MIVSARVDCAEPQIDGRRYVTETQVDDRRRELRFVYLASADQDIDAIMAARTAELNAEAGEVAPPALPAVEIVAGLVGVLTDDERAAVLAVAREIATGAVAPEVLIGG